MKEPQRAGGDMDQLIHRYQNMVYGLALARTNAPAGGKEAAEQ